MNIDNGTTSSTIWRKFGLAGFAFFFIKGVLWLLAPFVFMLFV